MPPARESRDKQRSHGQLAPLGTPRTIAGNVPFVLVVKLAFANAGTLRYLTRAPASLGARVLPKSCNSDVWLSDKRHPQTSGELAILRKVRCMTALA
jgi:hypothetical protein